MDFPTLNINESSQLLYIKNDFYKKLGSKVKAAPNGTAILLFKENASLEEVLTSVETIRSDILYAIETRNKKNGAKKP
jgi:hypothetical protein